MAGDKCAERDSYSLNTDLQRISAHLATPMALCEHKTGPAFLQLFLQVHLPFISDIRNLAPFKEQSFFGVRSTLHPFEDMTGRNIQVEADCQPHQKMTEMDRSN